MPLLNTADAMFVGGSVVSKAYQGSSLVYDAGGGGDPEPVPFSVVRQNRGLVTATAATNPVNAGLLVAPDPTHLVLSCISVNKTVTTLTASSPYTRRNFFTSANASGAMADSLGAQTCPWNKGVGSNGGGQAIWANIETNVVGSTFRLSDWFPDPVVTTDVTSVTGTLGNADGPGIVFAMVGVDSSWSDGLATPAAWPNGATDVSWGTTGYTTIGVFQTGSADGDVVGGAAFLLGYKEVAAGVSTQATCSWPTGNPDQAYMILSWFDVS